MSSNLGARATIDRDEVFLEETHSIRPVCLRMIAPETYRSPSHAAPIVRLI